jgi:methylmalonyl-CoA/ethylmalonyl-CoA epimerase
VNVRKVDHIGIAVHSIADAATLFVDALGGEFIAGGDDVKLQIRTAQIRLGGFKIELMEPTSPDGYLQRFLDKRGPGFHHLTILVDSIEEAEASLNADGFETVDTDTTNEGWMETYIRPHSGFGTLIQFAQSNVSWDVSFPGITLDAVVAGRVESLPDGFALRDGDGGE